MRTATIQNPRSKWAGGVAEWREAVRDKNNYHLIMGPMSFSHPSLALQPGCLGSQLTYACETSGTLSNPSDP